MNSAIPESAPLNPRHIPGTILVDPGSCLNTIPDGRFADVTFSPDIYVFVEFDGMISYAVERGTGRYWFARRPGE